MSDIVWFFYGFIIKVYSLGIRLLAPFNEKAKLWHRGRKNQFIEKPKTDKAVIWMHCSSLGEFEQGRSVLEQLKARAEYHIVLTFFSPSGYEIRKNYEGADQVYYLPADSLSNARDFIEKIQPQMALFVKYDLWFNYLRVLEKKAIPVVLFAAMFREEQYFFKPYGKSFARILKGFQRIFVQNEESFDLLKSQGFDNAEKSGDTRIDRVLTIAAEQRTFPWLETFASDKPLLICGSTWQADEALLLSFFKGEMAKKWKLVLAPHDIHPKHIQRLKEQIELPLVLHSAIDSTSNLAEASILIIDNIGMLNQLYRYARISYIGGGFGAGIHNTLEPIAFQKPVLFGPKYQKFEEAKALIDAGGGFCIEGLNDLTKVMEALEKESAYQLAAQKAFDYIRLNKGASHQVTSYIKKNVPSKSQDASKE